MPDFTKVYSSNIGAFEADTKESSLTKPRGFEAGLHDVTIDSVEEKGAMKNDDSWFMYRVVYKGTGNRTISDLICVPTQDILYNGKPGLFQKVQRWFKQVLNETLTADNVGTVLTKYLKDPKKLVGLNLKAKVGYNGWHAGYVSKDVFNLVNKKGEALGDEEGVALKFSSRNAAKEHAVEAGILDSFNPFKDFPEVLLVEAPASPNDLTAFASKKLTKAPKGFDEDVFA